MISGETKVISSNDISIGDDCVISWNSQIMDTDFHSIYDENGNKQNQDEKIIISNHVWIGSRCNILKGSYIPPGSVIASGSTITGELSDKNCIYIGLPPQIIKKKINWVR